MPYTCSSCGRYQQGQSADGICPASECQPARQAKARLASAIKQERIVFDGNVPDELQAKFVELVVKVRFQERALITTWLRSTGAVSSLAEAAAAIDAGSHLRSES